MPYSKTFQWGSVFLAIGLLGGCGTYVPEMREFYQSKVDAQTVINTIVGDVQCEVKTAVQFLILDDMEQAKAPEVIRAEKAHGLKTGRQLSWLDQWAAQVTLTLTIDEKGTANPGVALNTPLPTAVTSFPGLPSVTTAQSFSLGFGGTASADATRKETLAWLIDFKKFTDQASLRKAKVLKDEFERTGISPCYQENSIFIESDLKLREWLYAATLSAFQQRGQVTNFAQSILAEAKASKKDVISHEITFVILYGGNITPTWKLVRVSANTGSAPLFSAQRTKTQDLIITLGPQQAGTLSPAAQNTILASQIGIAVANAIRNTQ